MVKKTKALSRLSNSDRKIQRLYQEAISEIRNPNVIWETSKDSEKQKQAEKPQRLSDRSGKRDKRAHKPRRTQDTTGRPNRGSLTIPVSKILPFRTEAKGYRFPVDFRKDNDSNAWVPRTAEEPFGITSETTDSECSEGYLDKVKENAYYEDEKVFDMDLLLQVLPLRSGDEEDTASLSSERSSTDLSLPPLYKRDEWREIIARAAKTSHSIPAKTDAHGIGNSSSLIVGNREIYWKERRRNLRKISLAERRARLRAVAARRSTHLST